VQGTHLEGIVYDHHDLLIPADDMFGSSDCRIALSIIVRQSLEFHAIGLILKDIRLFLISALTSNSLR